MFTASDKGVLTSLFNQAITMCKDNNTFFFQLSNQVQFFIIEKPDFRINSN